MISEVGKPPEFVLEIASRTTARRDETVKREGYAKLSVPECWGFDGSGRDTTPSRCGEAVWWETPTSRSS